MLIRENIPLKDYTTFRTGGPARFFIVVKSVEELQQAVRFAQEKNVPIFILGGGSNILVSDAGFSGLVIKIEISGKEIKNTEVIAGAGENWDDFVAYTVSQNLSGLENLSLIPGTVGAAPVQNIGAYGREVMDVVSWVEAFDPDTLKIKKFENKECGFTYRDSMFKKPEGKKYIITRVAFTLVDINNKNSEHNLKLDYKDVQEYIKNQNLQEQDLTIQKVREIIIDIRTKKLPDVKKIGTAGSFFKNPVITQDTYRKLLEKFPELPHFNLSGDSESKLVKIPAAWVLDKVCGFKGYKKNNVGVYQNQALVLVNFGNATSEEVLSVADDMTTCFKDKTGVELEPEVQII